MRKGMGIFSPVSGWMMAWGHNESTDGRQDEEEKTRENKRWDRTDGRIIMLRFSAILLSLHHYSEPVCECVSHCARRCWVIWAGSFIIRTCKKAFNAVHTHLFNLLCFPKLCEKQRETCMKLMKHSLLNKWTELWNSENLIGWCLLFCSHSH